MYFIIILFLSIVLNSAAENAPMVQYLFSHGLADSHKQAYNYLPSANQKLYILQYPLVTFDYPDVSTGFFKVNRLQTSLAQDNEIQRLCEVYMQNCTQTTNIVCGVSRGASTLINFMALYNPSNIAAMILESPFDCVENIVHHLAHTTKCGWIPGFKRNGHSFVSFIFCKYNPEGIRPIDVVHQIDKNMPILIVCSQEDMLVPYWSSHNLYKQLRQTGHKNTYILILPAGKHGKLIYEKNYGLLYQDITHAFYQLFNLPHDTQCATRGRPFLLQFCQPDV